MYACPGFSLELGSGGRVHRSPLGMLQGDLTNPADGAAPASPLAPA